jgi:hypothetical protein
MVNEKQIRMIENVVFIIGIIIFFYAAVILLTESSAYYGGFYIFLGVIFYTFLGLLFLITLVFHLRKEVKY